MNPQRHVTRERVSRAFSIGEKSGNGAQTASRADGYEWKKGREEGVRARANRDERIKSFSARFSRNRIDFQFYIIRERASFMSRSQSTT